MAESLVIVESPAKAKTIEKFLGKGFLVKSSYGHIRDLSKKKIGVDIENNFKPDYEIDPAKKKQVAELKKFVASSKNVWIATDEDREGEAIAWHLAEVLNLNVNEANRISFNEITKEAIQKAINNPRTININLVDAQQARRILDRLVGFELSPVLWKKVKPKLSAGRVQSVAVKLIVEREKEIREFKSVNTYKVAAIFTGIDVKNNAFEFKADLSTVFAKKKDAIEFLEKCKNAKFEVNDINTRPGKKSPAPPFTTSTLQQEASRKLGFSVSQSMVVAQKLYESGFITYMRTDSVHLSNLAIDSAKNEIVSEFNEKYSKTRQFQSKIKGAQEAHEAIRPTSFNRKTINGTSNEKRLYELIWKRTIASQMADAEIEKTTINIKISNLSNLSFNITGEVIKFDGFLKVYMESTDEEHENNESGTLLPDLKKGHVLDYKSIIATEKYSHSPYRFTEANLVKKLEELGIGRPSTYAPIISTVQDRGYVEKTDIIGEKKEINIINLTNGKISEKTKEEVIGNEKSKMKPTDMGKAVTEFLMNHFPDIMDYTFTASVEKKFDKIAEGKEVWSKMIDNFYKKFHPQVDKSINSTEKKVGERLLGNHPENGLPIYVKIGRFGPFVQMGETSETEKPRFASIPKGYEMDLITLEQSLEFFAFPRELGQHNDAPIIINIGRFGPYVLYNKKYYSLAKTDDPTKITINRAIEIINEKNNQTQQNFIKKYDEDSEIMVQNGKYGPYISYKKKNFKIPKTIDPTKMTYEEAMTIINNPSQKKRKGK